MMRQLALIINKNIPTSDIHHATDLLWDSPTSLTNLHSLSENGIRVTFWISKALVLRLAQIDEVLSHLLPLLSDADYGQPAARGFSILLAPDELLSKENGAVIRLLAKQRVFNICVPRLASEFRSAEPAVKPNYLVALSGILKNVPTSVLMPEIDTLLPLLLQSLDLPEADVKAATIETLVTILIENASVVESQVSSLVTRLLAAASNRRLSSPKTRLAALQCLRIFPGKIKDSTLLPLRGKVTWALAKDVLDDPKRSVRKEAIDCRAKWLSMDEPESE